MTPIARAFAQLYVRLLFLVCELADTHLDELWQSHVDGRLFCRCLLCGRASSGWEIGPERIASYLEGDPRRFEIYARRLAC
jgi:hypothetical protein